MLLIALLMQIFGQRVVTIFCFQISSILSFVTHFLLETRVSGHLSSYIYLIVLQKKILLKGARIGRDNLLTTKLTFCTQFIYISRERESLEGNG